MVRYEKKTDFITPLEEPLGAFIKRAFDITAALFLITLTLPLMCFCAVGVKISLGSPVIFRQRRVGRYGREFVMLKFRSMRVGTPSGFNGGSDKRKTRFGHFLRLTSLDELPQLFNVLYGEMSIVGPRPEIPCYVEKFKDEIPSYMLKHYAKPGITGLAQIKGYRGDTSLSERIKYDLAYIENWSVFLDIKIMLMTPARMINRGEKYRREK
jgi:lipopolysaccharide/colanic/teichoic acid biosynthesis glycosyltransferase